MRLYNPETGRHVDITPFHDVPYQLQMCVWYDDAPNAGNCSYIYKGEVTSTVKHELKYGAEIIDFLDSIPLESNSVGGMAHAVINREV